MVKTYILAPDYSTAPPPAGPVKLGSLLADPTELVPLYPDHRVAIPDQALLPVDFKRGFRATRSSLLRGDLGIWAQFCGMFGVGVEAGWTHETGDGDVISFKNLETHAFNPPDAYLRDTMAAAPVRAFMEAGGRWAAVYMITGLKIGRGGALETSRSRERGGKLKLGLSYPGTPAQVGPNIAFKRRVEAALSFEGSSDFIFAFRVRRISYKKGDLRGTAYNRGATMLDGAEDGGEDVPGVLECEEHARADDVELYSETGF